MSRHLRKIVALGLGLPAVLLVLGARGPAPGVEDKKPQSPIEVYEWSIWVGSPSQTTLNASRVYNNAMPGVIGTIRPKFEGKELAGKFPVAPISVLQAFGEPNRDVDVEIQTKKGMFLAHWPPAKERSGRLQWFGSDFAAGPPADIPMGYLPESHWFQKLRGKDAALFLKNESHVDRFLAYDTELTVSIPVRLRGGPDEYTLQNLTGRRLVDVAVIAPTDKGFRVGWLDELPAAAPPKDEDEKDKDKDKDKAKEEDAAKKGDPKEKEKEKAKDTATDKGKEKEKPKEKTTEQKAEAVFQEAEKPAKEEKEAAPLPAEGDADIRARVDQVLNRPVNVAVAQAPRRDVLGLIVGQVRLRYELDDRTIAKAEINLGQPIDMKAENVAARDALADVLGTVGLSYRVTEDGTLFVTTAARLAAEADKKGKVIEGPPVKLVMPPALPPSNPSYREVSRDALTRRLIGQGLRADVIPLLLDQYGQQLFEPGELIVLAHLSREAIDEAVILDVFPPPKKLVRTALLVVHGVDPRLQDRARALVQQLGDLSPKARESAESRLYELGPVAVPALEDALHHKDVEIVFRAERLLLRLNRPVP